MDQLGHHARPIGVVRQRYRRAKHRHHGIPDVFVERAALGLDEIRAGGEILVHQFHQLRRRQLFGEGGE